MATTNTAPRASAPLTCAQLGAAIEAVLAIGIYRDGPAMHTLYALHDALALHATRDSEPVCVPDGPLPVTVTQVEEALEEVKEIGLDAKSLRTLKRARDLLAAAEKERAADQAAAGGQFVTRAEFAALSNVVGIALARVELAHNRAGFADGTIATQLALAERAGDHSAAERAALKAIVKAFDRTIEQHHAAECRRRIERGAAHYHI